MEVCAKRGCVKTAEGGATNYIKWKDPVGGIPLIET